MASSSQILKYPPRLYEEGKSPLQNRSMNHSCYFSQIAKIREGLGPDVWEDLMKSTLGVFLKLTDAEYIWAAQTVHYFLSNQLRVDNDHEIWCLIDQMPIRFSLYEFADVTGLNCDVIDEPDTCQAAYHEFWNEMGVGTSDGPLFTELEHVMDISKAWNKEKRLMVGRLCLLSVGIHGIHHGSRIPLSSAKRVLDPVAFEKYPWGRVAFQSLIKAVKIVDLKQYTYVIHGCVHALLIWIYESVPGLAARYGFKRETTTGTPLLDWRSSRKRIKFKDFIANEKTAHGQVRVRHMIPVTEENMYPKWSDAADNQDGLLDNLLKDIIHNRLQNDAWKHVRVQRKKRKVSRNEDGESSIIPKEKRMKESKASDDERAEVSNKKHKPRKEHMVDEEEKTRLLDIYKMLENLNGTVSEMSKNLTSRMDVLESKVESLDAQLNKRFEVVETDLKLLKESKPTVVPNDFVATSNNVELDEANSKSASWIVEEKLGSQDGLPVKRVVKKAVFTVKTKKKKAGEVSEDLVLCEKKPATKGLTRKKVANVPNKGFKKPEQKKIAAPKGVKKTMRTVDDDVEDVTDKVMADNLKMVSSSEETFSNPQDEMANTTLNAALTSLLHGVQNLDGGTTHGRRVPQLAGSQKCPYVGNSTVKRIITDAPPSSSLPEHLQPVSDEKFLRLTDWLERDEDEEPFSTSNFNARFFRQIITPRDSWPDEKYGWLKDYHMAAAMSLFRRRFLRDPSKYPNQRIAFLDQDLISKLFKDYPQFDPNYRNFTWRSYYEQHVNGTAYGDDDTKKMWFVDVDHLYAYLFVNDNHWVALDIDLPKLQINVYDSIPTSTTNPQLVEQCMFLKRMIPAMLSAFVPVHKRKKSYARLGVKRIEDIPKNDDAGDCAIYSIKYIECLALGKSFDGLCDNNMQSLRTKLAAEMFDELGENAGTLSSEVRRTYFPIPQLDDS